LAGTLGLESDVLEEFYCVN